MAQSDKTAIIYLRKQMPGVIRSSDTRVRELERLLEDSFDAAPLRASAVAREIRALFRETKEHKSNLESVARQD